MVPEGLTGSKEEEQPTLSVVIPAYRSAEILARQAPVLVEYLDGLGIAYEIVVCDDGSDDDGATRKVVATLGLRYVAHPVNQGKGAAIRTGMLAARGPYRLFTDADVPFELDAIGRALRHLAIEGFDVVSGDRTLSDSHYFVELPLIRRLASYVYTALAGRIVTGGWSDTQCGLKGFRGEVAEELFHVTRIDGFAVDVELLYLALQRNYEIKRLAVRGRNRELSSVHLVRDGLKMVWDLARIRLFQMRGHYTRDRAAAKNRTPKGGRLA